MSFTADAKLTVLVNLHLHIADTIHGQTAGRFLVMASYCSTATYCKQLATHGHHKTSYIPTKLYLDIVLAEPWHVSHKCVFLSCLFHIDREPHVVVGLFCPLFERSLIGPAPPLIVSGTASTSPITVRSPGGDRSGSRRETERYESRDR